MSELIQKNDNRVTIRWKLLTGVSALALAAYISSAGAAKAEEASHPLIWLELDGQFAMQKNDLEIFNPTFLSNSPFDAESRIGSQKARPYIWEKGAAISFQPDSSDWILSASIHYGKVGRSDSLAQITSVGHHVTPHGYLYAAYQNFRTESNESHTLLDFAVGRDVGLGKFGNSASSIINLGVRFAQFHSSNQVGIKSQPTNCAHDCPYNRFYASFDGIRRFQGVGPALSWDASAMIAGNRHDGGLSLDWGVNGALLFGRQKISERHQTSEYYWYATNAHGHHPVFTSPVYHHAPDPISRSKKVTVTNLGGFAGVSWRYAAAKVTLGYRADYFFGVLDGGIDTAKKEDRAFYGPFVSISVGIGD